MRYAAACAHDVVHADSQTSVAAVDHGPGERVEEWYRLGEVRSQLVQGQRALLEGFEDQGEVELLQIAEPAVEELAGPARGARGEVAGFDQADAQAAGDRIQCAAAARDAGADHEDVEVFAR